MIKYLVLLVIVISLQCANGMTKPQIKKTMSLMKNQCLAKTGASEDQVDKIEQGVFVEDHNVMCYIQCIYKSVQVIKNERLNKELINKQVDLLYPAEMKESVKNAVNQCFGVQNQYSDTCEGVFYAAKCLYETDPATFVFP